jgi:hypothetical protein
MTPRKKAPARRQTPEPEPELQQGHGRSVSKEEGLKRIIKQHPQRDIPRVESVEPSEAPPKE